MPQKNLSETHYKQAKEAAIQSEAALIAEFCAALDTTQGNAPSDLDKQLAPLLTNAAHRSDTGMQAIMALATVIRRAGPGAIRDLRAGVTAKPRPRGEQLPTHPPAPEAIDSEDEGEDWEDWATRGPMLEDAKETLEDILLEEYVYHQLRSAALKRTLNAMGVQVPGQVD